MTAYEHYDWLWLDKLWLTSTTCFDFCCNNSFGSMLIVAFTNIISLQFSVRGQARAPAIQNDAHFWEHGHGRYWSSILSQWVASKWSNMWILSYVHFGTQTALLTLLSHLFLLFKYFPISKVIPEGQCAMSETLVKCALTQVASSMT
jgi:hypothetical protein